MTQVVASDAAIREIEQLLYREASFLDAADLDGWIELYTQDGTYWMPVTPEQKSPLDHISLFYDDRVLMEVRRRNIKHPRAASKDYPVRCSHIISNIRVADEADAACTVHSNFHCLMYYNGKQTMYGGRYTHELVRQGERWMIRHKRVDLINCDAALNTIIIYI
jgi:benzoate/toluate 1,2-dioxygenase beta subunit